MESDYFTQTRPEMLPFIPQNRKRVLEIGCGAGLFSASLPGTGEIWGIEPSPAAMAAATRLTKILNGTFDDVKAQLPVRFFDLVICNDVIEHMADHQKFLSEIGRYIAPGGMLVGSIPNVRFYNNLFQMLIEKDWHYTDNGILDRTHLAFFTQKSLRKTLERSGLRVVCLQGINTDIRLSDCGRTRIYLAAAKILSCVTLGYFSDIRHLQFAFQAVPADHQV